MPQNMDFKFTADQQSALRLLSGPAANIMLYGGSRSGKTFVLTYALLVRALKAAGSRHIILRKHGNAVRQAVLLDTLPKVMKLAFPAVSYDEYRTDSFLRLRNGSEVWFAGLDESENPEKILGKEFATLYFNECSELDYSTVVLAMSRLAQRTALQNRAYFDCNPPGKSHWTYRLFIEKNDPESRRPLAFPGDYAAILLNPGGNRENLPPDYLSKTLAGLPEKQRRRFLEGKFSDELEGALWTPSLIASSRTAPVTSAAAGQFERIVIGVDPAVSSKSSSDESGIIVCGATGDGHFHVLEDLSMRAEANLWAECAAKAVRRWPGAKIVCEINNGGELFEQIIRHFEPNVNIKNVRASGSKFARAEPVAALYARNIVHHAGYFEKLEEQMCSFVPGKFSGSPDRMDALVWALTELARMPGGRRFFLA